MSDVVKITTKLVKFILGDAKPLNIKGMMNFLAIMDILDEGLNKTNLSHFKTICHSDIKVWVKKGQILHIYTDLKDTGNVLNTTLFKSSSSVAIVKDDISDMEKGSF
jgi:hypothetical protein